MAKRPSYVSIRARQRNIIEGLETKDLTIKQGAKRFGVTPKQLRRFTETSPKKLRLQYNRSPAMRKLYGASTAPRQRAAVREVVETKRIIHFEWDEREIHLLRTTPGLEPEYVAKRVRAGERLQPLYTGQVLPRNLLAIQASEWAGYAKEHKIPVSIKAIRLMHRNNRITDSDYTNILVAWRQAYPGITDDYYAQYSIEAEAEMAYNPFLEMTA